MYQSKTEDAFLRIQNLFKYVNAVNPPPPSRVHTLYTGICKNNNITFFIPQKPNPVSSILLDNIMWFTCPLVIWCILKHLLFFAFWIWYTIDSIHRTFGLKNI